MSSRRQRRSEARSASNKRSGGRLGTGRRDWLWGVAAGVLIIVAIFVGYVVFKPGPTQVFATVDGVDCERGERLEFHIHSLLKIYVNGEQQTVPANVGLRPNECIFWLHTHDASGLIHVEAPSERDFTLGQLFSVWGQKLSSTQLLDKTTDATHQVTAKVNGEPFTGDPSTIVFKDQETIVLQYGPPFADASR
jgi:hypothetical protein